MVEEAGSQLPFTCGLARLTVVRHGESTANALFARAVATGDPSLEVAEPADALVPLSEQGERQARQLGRWLASLAADERPQTVVCSPYLRAVRTWQLMAETAGPPYGAAPVDERLRDREMGVLELLTPPAVLARARAEADRRERVGEWFYRPPGGESPADVTLRVRDFLAELAAAAPGRRVLLVAHDAVVEAVARVLGGIGGSPAGTELPRVVVPNASVSSWVRAAGGRWLRPVVLGGTGHLAEGSAP